MNKKTLYLFIGLLLATQVTSLIGFHISNSMARETPGSRKWRVEDLDRPQLEEKLFESEKNCRMQTELTQDATKLGEDVSLTSTILILILLTAAVRLK